jgi:hypothetical protein
MINSMEEWIFKFLKGTLKYILSYHNFFLLSLFFYIYVPFPYLLFGSLVYFTLFNEEYVSFTNITAEY